MPTRNWQTPRILMVGNFLSGPADTPNVCTFLSDQFEARSWKITRTSNSKNKVRRILDMSVSAWQQRLVYDIAIVEVFSGPAFLWAETTCWTLRQLNKPYVLSLHGGRLIDFSNRWPKRVSRLLHSAAAVTTPSKYMVQKLEHIRDNIIWIPNPIDIQAYQYKYRPSAQPNLAWLRAFHPKYNPDLVVEAVSLLLQDFPNIELTMYGPERHVNSLKHTKGFARKLKIADRVHFPGKIPKQDVPRCLSRHDVFLNTTSFESFGISVVEAAALGLCIITTDVGELPYIWSNEYDALLVSSQSAEAFAAAIRRVLNDPGLASRLSKNARLKSKEFDQTSVIPRWETIIGNVLNTQAKHV